MAAKLAQLRGADLTGAEELDELPTETDQDILDLAFDDLDVLWSGDSRPTAGVCIGAQADEDSFFARMRELLK